jgi:hypothetical protein
MGLMSLKPPNPYAPPIATSERRFNRLRTVRIVLWIVAAVVWLLVFLAIAILVSMAPKLLQMLHLL